VAPVLFPKLAVQPEHTVGLAAAQVVGRPQRVQHADRQPLARGGRRAHPAAPGPTGGGAPAASACSRSLRRMILPLEVRGRSVTKRTSRGRLYGASEVLVASTISSADARAPSR